MYSIRTHVMGIIYTYIQQVEQVGATTRNRMMGSASEEGKIPLHGPVILIVSILWNDFTKSKLQIYRTIS